MCPGNIPTHTVHACSTQAIYVSGTGARAEAEVRAGAKAVWQRYTARPALSGVRAGADFLHLRK